MEAAVLVPNCPVCHQSASLAARALEQAGIATIVMGAARDIVEHVGVPRLLFSNLPLGNSAGRPNDPASQILLARLAVDLLQSATAPRTTVQSPLVWNGDPDWQSSYSNAANLSLVLGIGAVITAVSGSRDVMRREGALMLASTVLFGAFVIDGTLHSNMSLSDFRERLDEALG